MNRILLLAGTLSVGIVASTAGAQVLTPVTTSPPADGMVWELQSLTDGSGRATTLRPGLGNPTVQFDGRAATGSTSCNSYRAGYASRADLLRFGPTASTRRGCLGQTANLERQFLKLLRGTNHYTVAGNVLTLYSGADGRLVFQKRSGAKPAQPTGGQVRPQPVQPGADAPVVAGVRWRLLTVNGQTVRTNSPVLFSIEGKRLSGSDGCNGFTGEGNANAGVIRATTSLVGTQLGCSANNTAPSLPNLLQHGAAYSLSGDALTLTGDGNTWVFTALVTTQTPPPAATRLPSAVTIFDRASASDLGPDEDLLIVGPLLTACNSAPQQPCLLVKHPGEAVWSVFSAQIEGFRFRPGVTSLLRVRVERLAHPAEGGSNVRYRLVRVLGTQNIH
ncbi:META domain-containing protein [Deinococcus radiomollis]|uniref:META domain-containing protein n=1 Tax=Deinococcus radiomollis TaxID=468916 RepID=UPI003891BB3A